MANKKSTPTVPQSTSEGSTHQIEETAYYTWLNRERYAQTGDELGDWIEAEKAVRNNR
jgi:hypothetical protein